MPWRDSIVQVLSHFTCITESSRKHLPPSSYFSRLPTNTCWIQWYHRLVLVKFGSSVESYNYRAPSGRDVLRWPVWLSGTRSWWQFFELCSKTSVKQPPAIPYYSTPTINLQNFYKTTTYTHKAIYLTIFHYISCDTFMLRPKYDVK
jgi:hypothetical protein